MIDPVAPAPHATPQALTLKDTEARLRLALQTANIGIWEFDVATGALIWDARVREVVEADPDVEPTWADHFLPAIHPEDKKRVEAAFQEALQPGGPEIAVEFRVVGACTGKVTWASLTGRSDEGPNGPRLLGTARDITAEREGAQLIRSKSQALEDRIADALAERQLWADIIEASDEPVAVVDTELNLIALNRTYVEVCQRLFGVRLHIGANIVRSLDHMPEARDAAEAVWKYALSGKTYEMNGSQEAGPAGRFYDVRFSPLRNSAGAVIGAFQVSRDVTRRMKAEQALKAAEQALQQAQKMEAIGNLTGGVAHDFNNLLQVVSGNLQLLERDVLGNEKAERRIVNAQQAVARGAKLAAQLLAFGRRQALEPRIVNVGRLVLGMDELLRRALGEETEVESLVSGGLWNSMVDPTQIENALLNLAINGRDAMGGQGKLTIEVANAFLDDAYARLHPEAKPGQYVLLAVTDTGAGMTPDILEKVFEPFFSTKPEGHGTGLGLSMVYGFVKQSGGHIKIYSEVGHGTTVKLYLPRAIGPEDVINEAQPPEPARGDATILVVEDDDQVRETAVSLLTELGYDVLRAGDAASALAIVESGAPVDLIFTDVVMPGPLRSIDLAKKVIERLPHVAILYTSGYTQNAVVHGGRLDAGVDLLTKPYTREALALKVAKVLAQKRAAASG
jgi:signal transduction histidine kinase/ActR/RegA family two-component response regulator